MIYIVLVINTSFINAILNFYHPKIVLNLHNIRFRIICQLHGNFCSLTDNI